MTLLPPSAAESSPRHGARPLRSAVRVLLLSLIACACFLNYWEYSRQFHSHPDAFLDIVQGAADAPQQYRVLVVRGAWFVHQHAHLGMRHAFTLFDFVGAVIAGLALLSVVERSERFLASDFAERCFAYAAFLFLFAYDLVWLEWYQRPETLPTACFVALMLLLIHWPPKGAAGLAGIAACALLLSLLQALTRADVAACFFAGVFLAALLPFGKRLPAPRGFLAGLALVAAGLAVAVQWVMIHLVYPHATYGSTAVFQLLLNLNVTSILPFLLFLVPVIATGWAVLRGAAALDDAPSLALGLGALIFLPLWCAVGRIAEVRIFLPFALALIPLSVSCALGAAQRVQPATAP